MSKTNGRPRKDALPKGFTPKTAADWERVLRAEGMPAELAPIETKYLCSPDEVGHGGIDKRSFPKLCEEVARVHLDRAAADAVYSMATDVLWSGLLDPDEFSVWRQFCEGHGRPAIRRITGIKKWRVDQILAAIRLRFGLEFTP